MTRSPNRHPLTWEQQLAELRALVERARVTADALGTRTPTRRVLKPEKRARELFDPRTSTEFRPPRGQHHPIARAAETPGIPVQNRCRAPLSTAHDPERSQ